MKRGRPGSLADELEPIVRRGGVLPILHDRTAEEILGYDENGLPYGVARKTSCIGMFPYGMCDLICRVQIWLKTVTRDWANVAQKLACPDAVNLWQIGAHRAWRDRSRVTSSCSGAKEPCGTSSIMAGS